jgi:hypothetical protein
MKLFYIFGTAAAGVLGYMAEPSLRFQLTGTQPSPVEMAENGKVMLQVGDDANQTDLASLTPEQLPQKITIHTEAKVSDSTSGLTMTIQAGNKVKLVRVEAGNAVISPGEGPFSGKIPVMDTDLLQQLAANPPASVPASPPVAAIQETAAPPAGESAEPVKTPEPPPVPEPAPAPEPAPVVEAPTMEEPAATPTPEPASAGTTDVVKAMQDSIKAAQIKEFNFEQVTEWKAAEVETVDGESYQTGLASYTAETIFGTKTIQAKALVKAGKVHRWIWPKSGMEIK